MTVLLDHADPVILIETYGMGPVRIAQDVIGRMLTPEGVVQSSARRSIQLSLMIVDERLTVQDLISSDFFIPIPLACKIDAAPLSPFFA